MDAVHNDNIILQDVTPFGVLVLSYLILEGHPGGLELERKGDFKYETPKVGSVVGSEQSGYQV